MRHARVGVMFGLVLGLMLAGAGSAAAGDGSVSYTDGMLRKLGRGISNIVTGPLELIRTPELVGQKDGMFAGLSVGIVQGAWNGVVRMLAGGYETLTFFAEVPDNFEPVVKPEFVWEHGNWAE